MARLRLAAALEPLPAVGAAPCYRAGSYFGEVSLLHEGTRTAGVRAASYCELMKLEKAAFWECMHYYPRSAEVAHPRGSSRLPGAITR